MSFLAFASKTPEAAGLGGGIFVCYLALKLFPDLSGVFFLVPGATITRPWQVLTAGYFEDSSFNLLLGVSAVLGVGALLKSSWGGHELLRFVLLINTLQACATWVAMIVLYILFRSEHFLFVRAS